MPAFVIHTKDDRVLITAEDKDHAFAKYFLDIIEGKIPLDKIGNIIMLKPKAESSEGEEIGCRTAPLLWKMGVLGTKVAIDNIVALVGVTRKEAKEMLKAAAEQDARFIPLIEELRLAEEKT